MNCFFKKALVFLLFAGITVIAGAAEKVWNFNSIKDLAPPPWAKTAAAGYIDDGKNIDCTDGKLVFTLIKGRSWFLLDFGKTVLDAKQYKLLKFRFYSPVPGKITLFYLSPSGEMANMDIEITVADGWNEYMLDMNAMTFGQGYSNKACKNKNYKRWGGELKKVNGLRIDTWFPKGTTVKFDYIKLLDGKTNLKDKK